MDILERIKKLHALATRNSSTHEAAAAAAKAQELCFQHNLELEEVIKTKGVDKAPYVKADYVMKAGRNDAPWKRTLFDGICKANFCKDIYYPGTSKMGVVGQRHNFEVVCYLFEYLTKEIERLALDSCIKEGIFTKRGRYIKQFCQGAADAIYWRFQEILKARTVSTEDCRALVVVKDKELDAAVKQFWPRLGRGSSRKFSLGNGFSQGQATGRHIGINPGVGQGSRALLS